MIEQADARGPLWAKGAYHRHLKRANLRKERRRARLRPECVPAYRKFCGYET